MSNRTARRANRTRQTIIEAAEQLLAEQGSEAITLAAVAERADVAVQTVYNRVGSRSALLVAVAARALEDNRQYMDAAYATTEGGARDRIARAADAYARFALERPTQFRILTDPPDEPEALEQVANLISEQNGKLAAAIRDGIADGTIRPDLDPELAATAGWAMTNGILALARRPDALQADPARIDALVAFAKAAFWAGIAAEPQD
jgi:AcrR family transcriptional regulator